jgi:hypothetical protein
MIVPMLNLSFFSSFLLGSRGCLFMMRSSSPLHNVVRNFFHVVHVFPPRLSCLIAPSFDAHCLMLLSPFTIDGRINIPSAMHRSDILCTFNSFQAMLPYMGAKKGVLFYGGVSPSKIGLIVPY